MNKSVLVGLGVIALCGSAVAQDTTKEFKAYMTTMMPKIEKAFASLKKIGRAHV